MSDLSSRVQRSDWSTLPPELLQLISERVEDIGDYVRFGAVCKPWLSASSPPANLPRQVPWMLLPYDPDDSLRQFFSPSNRRTYKFDLLCSRGCCICSSLEGWLLMTDVSLSFSLLNPFTREHIHLPPLSTSVTALYQTLLNAGHEAISERFVRLDLKAKLMMTPVFIRAYIFTSEHGERIIALAIGFTFVYFREQDKDWIYPTCRFQSLIKSLTYHGGRFYIIYEDGEVIICELSPKAKPILIPSLRVPVDFKYCYPVSVAGELLLVSMSSGHHIHYFKMDPQLKWSKIQGIGDHILFLTLTNIVAVESSGWIRNCNYACRDLGISSPAQQMYGICAKGDNVEQAPHLPDWVKSIWFKPSLC